MSEPYEGNVQVTDEEQQQLISGLADLRKALAETDDDRVILNAIERTVADVPDATTLEEGADRLRSLVGPDATTLILWVSSTDTDDRLGWVEAHGDPSSVAFLRKVGGLYGPELRRSYNVWNENPESWSNIFRDVFFDLVTQQYRVRIRIRKYSGEEVLFEGPPDSILDLTNHMLVTLNYLPSKEVFVRESLVESFIDLANDMTEKLKAVPEEAPPPVAMTPAEIS
jgi:hypothetical protein